MNAQLLNDNAKLYDEEEHERENKMWSILGAVRHTQARPEAYLKGRGITIMPPNAKILPAEASARLGERRFPAMVLPFSRLGDDGVGRIVGVQCTWLTPDMTAKLPTTKTPLRKSYGTLKGGYIALGQMDAYDKPLLIGEGVETLLAAMQITPGRHRYGGHRQSQDRAGAAGMEAMHLLCGHG
jgi:hypothetical protein